MNQTPNQIDSPLLRVVCRKNGADCKIFTDGKVYDAHKEAGKEYCKTWVVIDDFGHERVILPDQPSPHLVQQFYSPYGYGQNCVGIFESVAGN